MMIARRELFGTYGQLMTELERKCRGYFIGYLHLEPLMLERLAILALVLATDISLTPRHAAQYHPNDVREVCDAIVDEYDPDVLVRLQPLITGV